MAGGLRGEWCRPELLSRVRCERLPVYVCQQTVEMMGKAEMFTNLGFGLEFARDAFIRFALEGATVISL